MRRLIIIAETKKKCELLQFALNTEQFEKIQLLDASYNSIPSVARTCADVCLRKGDEAKIVVAFNSYFTRRDLCDEKLATLRYLIRQHLSVGVFCFHPDMSTLLFYNDEFIDNLDDVQKFMETSSSKKLIIDSVPIQTIQKFLDDTELKDCVDEIFDKA